MKPIFNCMVTWIFKTVVSGRHSWVPQLATHSPHVTVWFGFTGSFILESFFFDEPVSDKKTCVVTAERYLTLLRDHVVPALQERHALPVVIFMQDGAPPHIAQDSKRFLLESFTEDRVISCGYKILWPSRSPDLNPAGFWLWGYLKFRVYRGYPTTLVELKNAIHLTVAAIHGDMLHSAVMGLVTRLTCLLSCGGDNIEYLLL